MADDYWLLSVPGDPTRGAALGSLEDLVGAATGLSSWFGEFAVPQELKVGTLDSLMSLSDDLARYDPMAESVVRKISAMLQSLLEDHPEKLAETFSVEGVNVYEYLRCFKWDLRKYSLKSTTRDIVDGLVTKITEAEHNVKTRQAAYSAVKANLNTLQRNETGSLLSRNLEGVVERMHVVCDSAYLQSVMVCVPNQLSREWQNTYETLTDMVVPRSAIKITSDQDYELWSVTMLKRVVDEFKHAAREKKFIVRDFTYDSSAKDRLQEEMKSLEAELKKQWGLLVRWGKTFFSETVISWVHLKAVRVFVESVLRYGLPPNFSSSMLCPVPKKEKALRRALQNAYQQDTQAPPALEQGELELPVGMSSALGEYYPYVSFSFSLNFLPKSIK